MNREILFRGWNDKHNKWLYGYYVNSQGFSIIITENYEEECTLENVLVNIKTVGQYTGLKDTHGKDIYEGDIVSIGNNLKAVVIWFNGSFRFKDELSCKATYFEDMGVMMRDYDVCIIGNIYDNPELLKGGDE